MAHPENSTPEDALYGWDSPPRSEIEGWNLRRRDELLMLTERIFLARHADQHSIAGPQAVQNCVDTAKQIIAAVDRAIPKNG